MGDTEWTFDRRTYRVTKFSDVASRDGFGWELREADSAPLMEAFWDDSTGQFTMTAFVTEALPFRLVEQFVREASGGVPPSR